ncbi:leucine-rich repeat and IQ domain-containing protein 1-like [Actinia tenebrosa]|uniref:Leucine-rich repeat and IQ domain-containing protein 1-like n=1 Tax=Actinia tenebrosa TaxID=6105 RepID=A0A6P8GYR3_ACTTE|nr:leucine-rich repeat and IQ domain-containing protein 1-like [Actinia tenebrosa]
MMTGIIGDDEAEIEAEIQRELDEICEDNIEIEDLENEDLISPYLNEKDADVLPDSLQQYLRAVQSRTEGVEQDVRDCDTVLNKLPIGGINDDDEQILARKIKEALGDGCHDDPLDIRKKVLSEIEELEQNEEKEKIRRESNADNMAIDIIRTDISDQIRILEEAAEKQLLELEEKQANKKQKRNEWYEDMKREENKRMEKVQEMKRQRQQELETAQKRLNESQQVIQKMLEKEAEQGKQKLDLLQQQFQVDIQEIEEESKKEKAALEEMKNQEAEYQRKKQNAAAVKIQKTYRGHRVYLQHKNILQQRRSERIKKYEEELEQQEREEKKKMEEVERRKQEEKRNEELQEKKRIEEERKRKEEQWKREREEEKQREEEKKKLEQLKKDEEKKKKIEEEREEQKRREEKRKIEELKKEEEKKRKEEEEREEQKRREKRKIQELKKEEEKKQEEAKKKELELIEKRKKEEEEERRKAEEKIREDELRKEIERKKEEQKRIEEEKKTAARRKKLEEIEKQKMKEEEKMKEEQRESEKKKMENKSGNPDINRNSTKLEGSEEIQNCLGLRHLEERRLQWVQEYLNVMVFSSTTSEDRVQPVAKMKSRQRPRRPFSASKNLPSLTEEQLLQASPPMTTLNKVVRVCVSSLPACNMHGVKRCPDLQSLTIHNCGLMAVESIEECTSIRELRVQDNCIEYVSCRGIHNLEEIQLNNNNLTSVQGFDGCRGLRCLYLSNNKITRLGDLSSCCKLQTLCLDSNQLIMTKGLLSLPNLQSLSCANNHLPNVKEIDSCQLLQSLNLQGNNLQQPPVLSNHVLLRELRLDDNSISTLEPLSKVWLPSLRLLSASQNSISKLDSLEGLIMLETLDVSHNLISDLDWLIPGLSQCRELKVLRIAGNPVNEDPDCRKAIVESLAFLTKLDDESLQPKKSSSEGHSSSFITMCLNQLTEYDNMMARHDTELSSFSESEVDPKKVQERLNIKSKQFEERHQLAVTHLQQHERYGTGDEHLNLSRDAPRFTEKDPKIMETMSRHETCEQPESRQSHDVSVTLKAKASEPYSFEGVEAGRADEQRKTLADDSSILTTAAIKIQSVWRGWYVRHLIDLQMNKWLAAVTIQAAWRGYRVRSRMRKSRVSRARKALWDARDHAAATTIQACYRGYRARKRIASALQAVNYYNDDDDDDDFNYDEEVDLSAFDYDSGLLDEGWTPTDTPQLPSRGPILPGPGQSSFHSRSKQSEAYMPRQAWRSADSPMEQGLLANQRGTPRVHNDQRSPEQDLMSVTSGTQSHLTHRQEEMSSEWGVRDPSTAELMWKRANRMKYNPARKRKLLDPNKRLALFKKLDEANKLREVKPPPKRQPQRVDYFAARDSSMLPSGSNTPTLERQAKAQMTYSWVYNQGVIHVDQDEPGRLGLTKDYSTEPTKTKKSPGKRYPSKSRSPISLPQMDPVALTGRNVPLVSSPALIREQISKDSTPTTRRYSSASEQIHFPPIKTYSVPNLTARSAASEASSLSPEKSNSAGARMTKERKRR